MADLRQEHYCNEVIDPSTCCELHPAHLVPGATCTCPSWWADARAAYLKRKETNEHS